MSNGASVGIDETPLAAASRWQRTRCRGASLPRRGGAELDQARDGQLPNTPPRGRSLCGRAGKDTSAAGSPNRLLGLVFGAVYVFVGRTLVALAVGASLVAALTAPAPRWYRRRGVCPSPSRRNPALALSRGTVDPKGQSWSARITPSVNSRSIAALDHREDRDRLPRSRLGRRRIVVRVACPKAGRSPRQAQTRSSASR